MATDLWHWWSVCGVLPKMSWLVSKHDPCSQQHAQQYGKAQQAASTAVGYLKDWLNSSSHVQCSCGPHLLTLTEAYFMDVYYTRCAIRLSQQYLGRFVLTLLWSIDKQSPLWPWPPSQLFQWGFCLNVTLKGENTFQSPGSLHSQTIKWFSPTTDQLHSSSLTVCNYDKL